MTHYGARLFWSLVVVGLAGCGGSAATTHRFFALAPPAPRATTAETRPTLKVRELQCAAPYDQPGVIFRVSAVEVRSYRYANWTSTPGVMVAEVLRRYLQATGLFTLVAEDEPADLELGGRVDAIEQVAEGHGWQGRLSLSLVLRSTETAQALWRTRIEGQLEADGRDVSDVVAAQSVFLGRSLAEVLPELRQASLRALAGPPAGSSPPPPQEAEGARGILESLTGSR